MKAVACLSVVYFIVLIIIVLTLIPYSIVKLWGTKVPEKKITQKAAKIVNVYIKNQDTIKQMPLEYYIVGVVAAEMPAEFHKEALKAQAVAARTYTLLRIERRKSGNYDETHKEAGVCTDYTHCQAWVSKQNIFKSWGFIYSSWYWRKIMIAVYETWDEIITCNGEMIDPVFHSNSSGRTENSEEVWSGPAMPYLRSVVSEGEQIDPRFSEQVEMDSGKFITIIKSQYPEFKIGGNIIEDVVVQDYTTGGRVKTIKIGNIILKGTEVRTLFGLRSANFKIAQQNGKIVFTTLGYGHGVGMSQWGANFLAQKGYNYKDILKHYYTGVEVVKCN